MLVFSKKYIYLSIYLLTLKPFFLANCISCYTCTSKDSWEDCNSKMTKTECPSGTPNCAISKLTCSAGGVTKTFFYKRCGTKGKKCQPKDQPSCPTSKSRRTFSSEDSCCTGNNCNSGALTDTKNYGGEVLTGVHILLSFVLLIYL